MSRISALLTTEGTYPFHRSGVSAWCHALMSGLEDVDFTVLAVTTHPYLPPRHVLPANVTRVITAPMSGMEDPAEYGNHASLPEYLRRRWITTAAAIEQDYLPHFERFLQQATGSLEQPRALAVTLLEMHLHLRYYDYHGTLAHPATWNTFAHAVQQAWFEAQPGAPAPTTAEILAAWRFLYRALLPLSIDVPHFDLAHATAPGFCGLPCVVGKLHWRTPYLLTEHGAYLRDHYVATASAVSSLFVRWLASRVTGAIVDVSYALADQVSPACERTAQWERWRGVDADRIRLIHSGVAVSPPVPLVHGEGERQTVVSIGELTPPGGHLLLIEAAAIVRRRWPAVEFRLHGAVEDHAYRQRCVDLVKALGLEQTVSFADEPEDRAAVLRQAHVVAIPGAPDGIPAALLEAMMAQSPIVAVDEGGAAEALGSAGLVVPPANPVALAEGITTLLQMPDSGRLLGAHARERALDLFTAERFLARYGASYERLARAAGAKVAHLARKPAVRRIAAIA